MYGSIFNDQLVKIARFTNKQGFVDPTAAGGGAPPGGDPSGGGGAPPGGDPSGGGAPPADPSAGGGGPDLAGMIQTAVQQAMATQGGGMGGGMGGPGQPGGPPKLKIDVNIEIMQIKKMLAKIVDALGIPVPAQDMAVDQNDITQMAQQNTAGQSGGGGGGTSPIAPVGPVQAAPPPGAGGGGDSGGGAKQGRWEQGSPYPDSGIGAVRDKAAALALVLSRRS